MDSGYNISQNSSILNTVMTAGGRVNSGTTIIILCILLFALIAVGYYMYYVVPNMKTNTYYPNNEQIPTNSSTGNDAELLFFYADWCPHCKSAKPVWNEFKSEYEHKQIKGYNIIFTEIDCTNESAETEKLMDQYDVDSYPTIKLVKSGQIITFDAKPSNESLTAFLNSAL